MADVRRNGKNLHHILNECAVVKLSPRDSSRKIPKLPLIDFTDFLRFDNRKPLLPSSSGQWKYGRSTRNFADGVFLFFSRIMSVRKIGPLSHTNSAWSVQHQPFRYTFSLVNYE